MSDYTSTSNSYVTQTSFLKPHSTSWHIQHTTTNQNTGYQQPNTTPAHERWDTTKTANDAGPFLDQYLATSTPTIPQAGATGTSAYNVTNNGNGTASRLLY